MQIRYHNIHENRDRVTTVLADRITLGRSTACDIVLNSPLVSGNAAVLSQKNDSWILEVQNENGCEVEGQSWQTGTSGPLCVAESFRIFPFEFSLDPKDSTVATEDDVWKELEQRTLNLMRDIHMSLLDKMKLASIGQQPITPDYVRRIEQNLELIAEENGIADFHNNDLVVHIAGNCVHSHLIDAAFVDSDSHSVLIGDDDWSQLQSGNASRERELRSIQNRIYSVLRCRESDPPQRMRKIENGFREAWHRISKIVLPETLMYLCLRQLKKQIKDNVFGYGPLEDMLRLPTISEIMVMGCDRIYIERNGIVENSGRRFISNEVALDVIDRIVSKVGRRIDVSQPIVDARLSDGSRINAVIPPIALDGPLLTVRKFASDRLTIDRLIEMGSLTEEAATFLRSCVTGEKNIVVSGGTGTGKTTLLGCLADVIPETDRIITIEDTAELSLSNQHVARMETRPSNIEGNGELAISQLVRNALRMRPDRIIVGECRGEEALWMLQAMNTGHDGSLTTIHANTAEDVVMRLEVMVQTAMDLPVEAIHRQIASAIDVVVQLKRLSDGSRVVSEIAEVLPPASRGGRVQTRQVFARKNNHRLAPTGRLPTFIDSLVENKLLDLATLYPTTTKDAKPSEINVQFGMN